MKAKFSYKNKIVWIIAAAIAICAIIAICFLAYPTKKYQIKITIPAGSTAGFCYSDEEISPGSNTLTLTAGEGLGDTEIVLLPIEVREENAYDEAIYMTPGMPVRIEVEKGAWYKIGVNIQNPTEESKNVYISADNIEVRIQCGGDLDQAAENGQPAEGEMMPDEEADSQKEALSNMRAANILIGSDPVALSKEDAVTIRTILNTNKWQKGTADCINNCRLTYEAIAVRYHSDCGTFNDLICDRHMPLSEEDKAKVDAILEKYISLQAEEAVMEIEPPPTASPEPSPEPSPKPQFTARPGIDTGYPGYDALIAEIQDVQVRCEPYTGEDDDPFSYIFRWYCDEPDKGFLLRDVDGNGVEELVLGENGSGGWNGVIYDLYTIVDGRVVHVFTGGERDRYYFCENGCIANESSNGAADSVDAYYAYKGTELTLIEALIYYEDKDYYSTEETYYSEDLAPEIYREITWEEVEEIRAKYVHEQPQFTSFLLPQT